MSRRRIAIAIDQTKPFHHYTSVISGIQRYAREADNWDSFMAPYLPIQTSSRQAITYDGVIGHMNTELLRQAKETGTPVVNVGSTASNIGVPSVLPDFFSAGQLAAEHLMQRGYQRFGFHGPSSHPATLIIQEGFNLTLKSKMHTFSKLMVPTDSDESATKWECYVDACQNWIASFEPPFAIFSTLDLLARYLAQICLEAGLKIPKDVAIIGRGNEPLVCAEPEPALTSISQNYQEVGYQGAQLLDQIISGAPSPSDPILIKDNIIISRKSTNYYTSDDPLIHSALLFILENLHKGIRVDDVAKHSDSTLRSLERRFKKETGKTMNEEMARIRLERATQLLIQTDSPLKQIAGECGYSSAGYFNQAFSKSNRITPREFRLKQPRRT